MVDDLKSQREAFRNASRRVRDSSPGTPLLALRMPGLTMPSIDRRDVSYVQARAELARSIAEESVSELSEPDRGVRLARLVRVLQDKYPDLDDQMRRRLMGDGMRQQTALHDPV